MEKDNQKAKGEYQGRHLKQEAEPELREISGEKGSGLRGWFVSLAVNAAIIIAVLAFTSMSYETNDDFAVASRIVDGYAEAFFVNYYLCRGLIWLQGIFSGVNVYVALQLAAAFAAFTCIYKLILDSSKDRIVHIVSALAIAVFSFDHYCTIQFTKTSAILLVAATAVLADAVTNRRKWPYYILSALLLYTGVAFRIDGLVAALAFFGLYMLKWLLDNRRSLKERGFFSAGRLVLYALLVVMFAGCYGFQNLSNRANTATEALKEYDEYNYLRSAIVDYPLFEYYENNIKGYDEIGISENDLYLIDHWVFDYTGAASKENLAKIVEVDSRDQRPAYTVREASEEFISSTVRSLKKKGFIGVHVFVLALLALWMALRVRPRHWIYILAVGAVCAGMHLALYYVQRPGYRAIYIADAGAVVWLLYAMSVWSGSPAAGKGGGDETAGARPDVWRSTIFSKAIGVCVILLLCASLLPLKENCDKAYRGAADRVMSGELSQYLQQHDDCFFTFSTQEKRPNASYAAPLQPPDTYHERNVMGTGSWGTMSPYLLAKLDKYGMYDPISDLIDNDKAFYVGNGRIKRMTEYYNKWYGSEDKSIWLEQTDEVDGVKIWSVKSSAQ